MNEKEFKRKLFNRIKNQFTDFRLKLIYDKRDYHSKLRIHNQILRDLAKELQLETLDDFL